MKDYIDTYLDETARITSSIDKTKIELLVAELLELRRKEGRLFFLGVGGSATNASHAAADLRKVARIESYSLTDNVSELTARINDDGWDDCFVGWLRRSNLKFPDGIFVLSVGGGNKELDISMNIVRAVDYAKFVGSRIFAIVGREDGYVNEFARPCIIIPQISAERVTPHAEEFQSILLHLLITHPRLKRQELKWESYIGR